MPAQSTISILESIKKKLQKFDEPSQKQETFADVKDEFEYISQSQAQSANQSKNSDDIYGNSNQSDDLAQDFGGISNSDSKNDQLNQNISSEENSLPDFDATFSNAETDFNSSPESAGQEIVSSDNVDNNQVLNSSFDGNKNNSTENVQNNQDDFDNLDQLDSAQESHDQDNSQDNQSDSKISDNKIEDLHDDEFSYHEEESDIQDNDLRTSGDSNAQEANRFEVSRLVDDESVQNVDDGNDHHFSHLEEEHFDFEETSVKDEKKDLSNNFDKNSKLGIDSMEFTTKNSFEEGKVGENKIAIDLDNIALKAENIDALKLGNISNKENLSINFKDLDEKLESVKKFDLENIDINRPLKEKAVGDNKSSGNSLNSSVLKDTNIDSPISNDLAKKTAQSIGKLIGTKNTVINVNKFVNSEDFSEIAARLMQPKIEKWLEDNLPDMVERAVEKEITRIIEKSEI